MKVESMNIQPRKIGQFLIRTAALALERRGIRRIRESKR